MSLGQRPCIFLLVALKETDIEQPEQLAFERFELSRPFGTRPSSPSQPRLVIRSPPGMANRRMQGFSGRHQENVQSSSGLKPALGQHRQLVDHGFLFGRNLLLPVRDSKPFTTGHENSPRR